ncbi:choice-of-anchor D domain-containing protein [Cellulomonas denverensis]|uniref:choice-of-anchor D domain-containing protein n=1 Tax=Cellulomonas denverensis TaxID=264297 RepID=UPI0035EDCD6E
MKRPLRALLALSTTVAVAGIAPVAAMAVDSTPPTASTGVVQERWGDPVSNDLFTVSAAGWYGDAALGTQQVTGGVITLTANRDITVREHRMLNNWGGDPALLVVPHAGLCPGDPIRTQVEMSACDTCQFWASFGPEAMDEWGATSRTLQFYAEAPDGTTASQEVRVQVGVSYEVEGEPLDFGEVVVGTTSAPQSFTISNTGTTPVDIDLTEMTAIGPFQLAPGQPTTVSLLAGDSAEVAVTFTPTQEGQAVADDETVGIVRPVNSTTEARTPLSAFTGTGIARQAALSSGPVDFGTVDPGATTQRPITVTNTGPVPLVLTADAVVQDGSAATPEDVRVELPADEVAPGESVTGTVTWNSATAGFASSVRITGTDADAAALNVPAATPVSEVVALTGAVTATNTPAPTTPPDTTTGTATITATRLATTGSGSTTWALTAAAGAVLACVALVTVRRMRRATR